MDRETVIDRLWCNTDAAAAAAAATTAAATAAANTE